MRRLMSASMAALLALALGACTTAPEGKATPCEKCSYGYIPVKKSYERHAFCMVNDKQVDCTKNPGECPTCK